MSTQSHSSVSLFVLLALLTNNSMSIRSIEEAKILKEYCKKLGREGMGEVIVALAKDIIANENDYVMAMRIAGNIRAITTGAQCDSYFGEKVNIGFSDMYWRARGNLNKNSNE